MRMAAIYARVSSEQQREANTIASQTASADRVRPGARSGSAKRVGLRR